MYTIGMTAMDWILVGVCAAMYVAMCAMVARVARRLGRRPWVWFWVCLLLTCVPAVVIFQNDVSRRRAAAMERAMREAEGKAPAGGEGEASVRATGKPGRPRRCPHCQAVIVSEDVDASGAKLCPVCHMVLNSTDLA